MFDETPENALWTVEACLAYAEPHRWIHECSGTATGGIGGCKWPLLMQALLWLNHLFLQEDQISSDGHRNDGFSEAQIKRLEELGNEWKGIILTSVEYLAATLDERTQLLGADLHKLVAFEYDEEAEDALDLIEVPSANNAWEVHNISVQLVLR